MTPIEHSILAFNLGALCRGTRGDRGFDWAVIVAALVPDVDGLSVVFGQTAYVRYHRTIAHSLPASVCLGVIVGLLMVRLWRAGPRPAEAWLWACAGGAFAAASHVLVDAFYPWPLPLLAPFTDRTWCWPLFPWGDLWIVAIMLSSMFAHAYCRRRPRVVALATLAALVGYGLFRWRVPVV